MRAARRRRRAWPAAAGTASRCSSTRCRTSAPDDVSALCAACHEISQQALPLVVVGAGSAASAGRAVGREVLLRAAVPLRPHRPARPRRRRSRPARSGTGRGRRLHRRRAGRDVRGDRRLPLLRPGLRQDGVGPRARARRSPRPTSPSPRPRPRASSRSASSAPATSAPRRPSGSTCGRWPTSPRRCATADRTPVPTAAVASRPEPAARSRCRRRATAC